MTYQVLLTKEAQKDIPKIKAAGLGSKVKILMDVLVVNPWQMTTPYEKLVGDLQGQYSRRINLKHRLVYLVLEKIRTVKILRMWTHYE